jgi:flagellar basal-body rod modification protein FlgD
MATVNPVASQASGWDLDALQAGSQTAGADDFLDTETFLQLLVAQIKNQNPLNPADGVEFLSQLAQFAQLEQTIAIHEEVQAIRGAVVQSPGADNSQAAQDELKA